MMSMLLRIGNYKEEQCALPEITVSRSTAVAEGLTS